MNPSRVGKLDLNKFNGRWREIPRGRRDDGVLCLVESDPAQGASNGCVTEGSYNKGNGAAGAGTWSLLLLCCCLLDSYDNRNVLAILIFTFKKINDYKKPYLTPDYR